MTAFAPSLLDMARFNRVEAAGLPSRDQAPFKRFRIIVKGVNGQEVKVSPNRFSNAEIEANLANHWPWEDLIEGAEGPAVKLYWGKRA
jgi:hypothetical protein